MAKYIIVYNTTDGAIIKVQGNPPPESVLASGTGTVSGNVLSGIDLAGNAQEDVDWIRLDSKWRFIIEQWNSSTEVVLKQPVSNRFEGSQDYELMQVGNPIQFTNPQKNTIINDTKTEEGHANVGAILIDTELMISPVEWKVNTSTEQLEKKADSIVYE